jgi:acetyltransferase-like isoleucine patch superfamily enzyme
MNKRIQKPNIFKLAEKLEFLFFWMRPIFFAKSKGINFIYLLLYFIPQKLLRINGNIPWPVHFTSIVLHPRKIEIGYNSPIGLNCGCYIQGKAGIKVGHNCRMGPNVGLISANHDPNDYDVWIDIGPIEIGDNVWIGMNTVIMPGVKIGNNVIIGANSTVNKDIPDNSIAVGSPCQVVKEKKPYQGIDYSKI